MIAADFRRESGAKFEMKSSRRSDVRFGILIETAMNCFIRPLEQHRFAIFHQLDASVAVFGIGMRSIFAAAARPTR